MKNFLYHCEECSEASLCRNKLIVNLKKFSLKKKWKKES